MPRLMIHRAQILPAKAVAHSRRHELCVSDVKGQSKKTDEASDGTKEQNDGQDVI